MHTYITVSNRKTAIFAWTFFFAFLYALVPLNARFFGKMGVVIRKDINA